MKDQDLNKGTRRHESRKHHKKKLLDVKTKREGRRGAFSRAFSVCIKGLQYSLNLGVQYHFRSSAFCVKVL